MAISTAASLATALVPAESRPSFEIAANRALQILHRSKIRHERPLPIVWASNLPSPGALVADALMG